MSSEEMIAKMRRIEKALPPELNQMVIFQKSDTLPDGSVIHYYEIPDGKRPPGYLWIHHNPETKEVLGTHMSGQTWLLIITTIVLFQMVSVVVHLKTLTQIVLNTVIKWPLPF